MGGMWRRRRHRSEHPRLMAMRKPLRTRGQMTSRRRRRAERRSAKAQRRWALRCGLRLGRVPASAQAGPPLSPVFFVSRRTCRKSQYAEPKRRRHARHRGNVCPGAECAFPPGVWPHQMPPRVKGEAPLPRSRYPPGRVFGRPSLWNDQALSEKAGAGRHW